MQEAWNNSTAVVYEISAWVEHNGKRQEASKPFVCARGIRAALQNIKGGGSIIDSVRPFDQPVFGFELDPEVLANVNYSLECPAGDGTWTGAVPQPMEFKAEHLKFYGKKGDSLWNCSAWPTHGYDLSAGPIAFGADITFSQIAPLKEVLSAEAYGLETPTPSRIFHDPFSFSDWIGSAGHSWSSQEGCFTRPNEPGCKLDALCRPLSGSVLDQN